MKCRALPVSSVGVVAQANYFFLQYLPFTATTTWDIATIQQPHSACLVF